jgi:hypothetical protein
MPLHLPRRSIPFFAAFLVVLLTVVTVNSQLTAHSSQLTAHSSQPTWLPDGLRGSIVHAIAPGHAHPGMAFAGAGNGVSRRGTPGHWRPVLDVGTVWSVDLLPDDRTVLAGDELGNVDISHDSGAHWSRHLVSSQGVYAVTSAPDHPNVILAGAGGGLFRSDDGGMHWQRRLALRQSAGAAFAWLAGDTAGTAGRTATVFAGAVAGGASGATQVYVSHDSGLRWHRFGRGLTSLAGIMSLATGRTGYLYAGTMGNRIWRVPLNGELWSQDAAGIPGGQHVAAIVLVPAGPIARQPPGRVAIRTAGTTCVRPSHSPSCSHSTHPSTRIYVGTLGKGVFMSRDAGSHWISVSRGLPAAGSDQIVLSLAYSPLTRTLLAGTTDGVYRLQVP